MQKTKTIIRTPRYFDIIIALFAGILLISNLGATKLIAFGPIITDGGAILFPLAYIFGDLITEVYGFKYARRAIWTGFVVMLLAVFAFTVVQHAPAAPEWTNQAAFESILGFFPRIVLASLAAYLVGEFINSFVLAKLKVRTHGKYLGARLIGSTFVGQLLDTTIFGLIAFSGILGGKDMMIFILQGWLYKTAVEVALLPITYRVIRFMKRKEGVDAYDEKTDFTPLKLSVNDN